MDSMFPLYALATVVSAVTMVMAWRRRGATPAATALAVTMASLVLWSGALALTHVGLPYSAQVVAVNLAMLGVHGVVIGFFTLSHSVTNPAYVMSRRTAAKLAIAPAIAAVVLFTDPWHELFYPDRRLVGDPGVIHTGMGPLFWVHMVYAYALLGYTVWRLIQARRRAPGVFRRQLTALLVAGTLPTIGNVTSIWLGVEQGVYGGKDYTPLFFTLTGVIDAWALFRLGLMQLVPVARGQVVDTIHDAVIVFGDHDRVVDVNLAADRLLRVLRPRLPQSLIGIPAQVALDAHLTAAVRPGAPPRDLVEPRPGLFLDLRTTLVSDRSGRVLGRVLVVRDVSQDEQQRHALMDAHQQLTSQVETIDRLRAELAEEVVRDALTGLHNRRHLMDVLATSLDEARTTGQPVSVLVLDIDHFKRVNDAHGHPVGDLALQTLSGQLVEGTRAGDTVARLGGEEFVVVLPGASREQATLRAEALRERCARTTVRVATSGESFSMTISCGVATYPDHASADPSTLLNAADRALYAAKQGGRDRVEVAGEACSDGRPAVTV